MNSRNTFAAALPTALALIGALALPTSEEDRIAATVFSIPDTPQMMDNFVVHPESSLSVCSFNIQFLGNSTRRDDAALAAIVRQFDIVLVQELVSPPYPGTYPNGQPFRPDPESAEFFDLMVALGFEFVLSTEDTGTGEKNHKNGSATEWWVAFYQPDRVEVADDLPMGFLASDRSNHDDYERVPFAFPFRSFDHGTDFVLISVHLQPGARKASVRRRAHELKAIAAWIDDNDESEHDFIIVGDMNIEDAEELEAAMPEGFESANDQVSATNTSQKAKKPYDHVMYRPEFTTELDTDFDFQVVDLIEAGEVLWSSSKPYPGSPYHHNEFRAFFSDHHPVVFHLTLQDEDDD